MSKDIKETPKTAEQPLDEKALEAASGGAAKSPHTKKPRNTSA